MIKAFVKIASIFLGFSSLLNTCSNEYRAPVKKYMKQYLKEKTGKDFEEVEFHNAMSTANSIINRYYGLWRAVDDNRIEIGMTVAIDFDTKEITPINPKAIDERIEKSIRCANISDQIEAISRKYVTPEFVQAKIRGVAGTFYNISLNIEDTIDAQISKKYEAKAKAIAKEIREKVLLEPNYFWLECYIYADKFPYKKVIYRLGISGNEPVGDYHIRVEPEGEDVIVTRTEMGLYSNLDDELKQKVKKEAEDKFDVFLGKNDVNHDIPPIKAEEFLEDVNEEGVREYTRYFVSIWDDARKKVIDRKFARVNIFTKEIEWYEVKEFPRPLKK